MQGYEPSSPHSADCLCTNLSEHELHNCFRCFVFRLCCIVVRRPAFTTRAVEFFDSPSDGASEADIGAVGGEAAGDDTEFEVVACGAAVFNPPVLGCRLLLSPLLHRLCLTPAGIIVVYGQLLSTHHRVRMSNGWNLRLDTWAWIPMLRSVVDRVLLCRRGRRR
jgi:hypothetical protein